jgi:Tfp pilus assembly protein PilF
VREFELAQQRDPDSPLYTRTLAYAYQRNCQPAEAMFRAAVAQTPDRVVLYRDLAYVQSNLGKQTEAVESLRKASGWGDNDGIPVLTAIDCVTARLVRV